MTDLTVTTLNPLYDRLIVDPDETLEQSAGGVLLPGGARQKPDTGVVVACGPGRLDQFGVTHPMPVVVGDKVLFNPHSGSVITVDDGEYLILNSGDVLAVVREQAVPAADGEGDREPAGAA